MRKISLLLVIILALPLISAFSFSNYSSPYDMLANEWAMFAIIVAILIVAIYLPIMKKTNNMPMSLVMATALALLLAVSIAKKGVLLIFLDESIVNYIAIAAIVIGLVFILYRVSMHKNFQGIVRFSFWRFIWAVIIIGLLSPFFETIIPEKLLYGPLGDYMNIAKGAGWNLAIALIVILIVFWLIKRWWKRREHYIYGKYKEAGEIAAHR